MNRYISRTSLHQPHISLVSRGAAGGKRSGTEIISTKGIGFVAVVAALAFGVVPAFAGPIYSDHTFNLIDYSASPAYSSDGSATISYTQCASCGVPGKALQFTSIFPLGPAAQVAQGLVNTGFVYDPVMGAIISIGVSVDKNITVDLPGTGYGNTFRPTIEQNGIFYIATIVGALFDGPGGPGYLNFSNSALLATDFFDFNFATGAFGSAHPDFAGDPILLGLSQISGFGNQIGTVTTKTIITQYDNLRFEIQSVPEPATLALVGVGFAGLGLIRRRKI